mgnify:CR=1 FL=1
MATADELAGYLANPNVQKMLRVIGQAEGTVNSKYADPYRVGFGGRSIESLDAHPNFLADFTQTDGTKNKTSAAGAYQFLKSTWDEEAKELDLKDFSPLSQDLAAINRLRKRGALDDVLNGRMDVAVSKLGNEWASLPSSPYAQPKRSQGFIEQALNAVIPAAEAAPVPKIDPSQVQWDDAPQAGSSPIDVSKVQWDDAPAAQQPYRVEMSQEDAQRQQASAKPDVGVMSGFGQGVQQGFGDVPAGIAQSSIHQGQQILQGVDQLFGTDLAGRAAQNVQARDAEVAKREADYQNATPGSISAGVGRVGGNLAFAMAGGPSALSSPMTTLSQAGAKMLPSAPRLGAGLGTAAGSGLVGSGYGAAAPVAVGDYEDQSAKNALAGAVLGAVTPSIGQALGATGRYIGRNIKSAIAPFSDRGREQIAENILVRLAKEGAPGANASEIVPGSVPTLAEATGNHRLANLQRTIRDLDPTPFVQREEANAAARLRAFDDIAGDASKLDFFRADRAATAQNYYGEAIMNYDAANMTPWIKGQITQLLKRPSIDKASRIAQRWAIERGEKPDPNGSLRSLHDVKAAVDDMIGQAVRDGKGGEAKALQATKDKLLTVMEKLSPDYEKARITYQEMSKPINQMEVLQGLKLTDQMGNITLQKVQTALDGLGKRMARSGVDPAKSLEAHQIGVLEAIRDDLLRVAKTHSGRSMGSATAQNLAMQNALSTLIPGKVGEVVGAIGPGSIAGGTVGALLGGPGGAAAGAVAGNRLGAGLSALMKTGNEDIQNKLARLLLNEGGSGLAALQRAASAPRPLPGVGGLERLLYPSVSVGGSLGMGIKTPSNAR